MTSTTGKMKRNRTDQGFTLIELVLVVFVLLTLTALTVPAFQHTFQSVSEQTAAHRLAELLGYARERAVMDRTSYRVQWDETQGTYWLSADKGVAGAPERLQERWGRTERLPQGVRFEAESSDAAFFPDGTATEASVRLVRDTKVLYEIQVQPLLGKVTITER